MGQVPCGLLAHDRTASRAHALAPTGAIRPLAPGTDSLGMAIGEAAQCASRRPDSLLPTSVGDCWVEAAAIASAPCTTCQLSGLPRESCPTHGNMARPCPHVARPVSAPSRRGQHVPHRCASGHHQQGHSARVVSASPAAGSTAAIVHQPNVGAAWRHATHGSCVHLCNPVLLAFNQLAPLALTGLPQPHCSFRVGTERCTCERHIFAACTSPSGGQQPASRHTNLDQQAGWLLARAATDACLAQQRAPESGLTVCRQLQFSCTVRAGGRACRGTLARPTYLKEGVCWAHRVHWCVG